MTGLCDWFRARGVERIEPFQMTTEDVDFQLPVELRRELALAERSGNSAARHAFGDHGRESPPEA